jgi:hypothetical protein
VRKPLPGLFLLGFVAGLLLGAGFLLLAYNPGTHWAAEWLWRVSGESRLDAAQQNFISTTLGVPGPLPASVCRICLCFRWCFYVLLGMGLGFCGRVTWRLLVRRWRPLRTANLLLPESKPASTQPQAPVHNARRGRLVLVFGCVLTVWLGGYYFTARRLDRYEQAKVSRAKIDCESLSGQVETYKLNNGDYPGSIDALASPQPNGMGALVPPDKTRDPWGKPYQIDPSGPQYGGRRADIYTTTPKGEVIGNW